MAWRPTRYLLEGELSNSTLGQVNGWMRFAGMKEKVTFELKGDFHRDIRGTKIHFVGEGKEDDPEATVYMEGFAHHHTGKVGDITAGLPPYDYVKGRAYIEIYSDQNGRIVLELEVEQVKVIGTPLPPEECEPISRQEQEHNMAIFMGGLVQELNFPSGYPIRLAAVHEARRRQAGNAGVKTRGMKLLTKEILRKLPPLYSQEDLGGKAIAYVKSFTPDSGWTWWATQGSPEGDDFLFFGLVEGHCEELGYFSLRELESVRGPLGLPIERDLHWTPKRLEEIAPEMFKSEERNQ